MVDTANIAFTLDAEGCTGSSGTNYNQRRGGFHMGSYFNAHR